MEQFNVIKQMVQFNKNAFDQGYNAMDMLQKPVSYTHLTLPTTPYV